MRRSHSLLSYTTLIIGFLSTAGILLAYIVLEALRPRMIAFEPLSSADEGLVNIVGVALLLTMLFWVMAILRIIRFTFTKQQVSRFHLLIIAGAVLSLILVFGDVALIGDIGKQYKHGLSQPEWRVLYIVMAFQLVTVLFLLYALLFTLPANDSGLRIASDSSILQLTHYVGVLCGAVGLLFVILNFFYPRPDWMVRQQMVATTIITLIPYGLILLLWVVVKVREEGPWLDEMQRKEIWSASFLSLVAGSAGLTLLYIATFNEAQGMVSVLWFPFYLFLMLLIFSASSIFFGRDGLITG